MTITIDENTVRLATEAEVEAQRILLGGALQEFSLLHFPQHIKMLPVENVFDKNWERITNLLWLDDTQLQMLGGDASAILDRMVDTEWHLLAELDEDKRLIVRRPGGGTSLRGTTFAIMSNKAMTFQSTTVDQLIELFQSVEPPIQLSLSDVATIVSYQAHELGEERLS